MGLFSTPDEVERKAKLKQLEDKRVAFAQAMQARGFRPERMLMSQLDNGGLVAVCAFDGKKWLIVGPGFGTEDDFALEAHDRFEVRTEEVIVKSEGMGGMFGFGKKGQRGFEYHITRTDGSEIGMPFVYGRNAWGEFTLAKNPLLNPKRRRGDANIVWDLRPIDAAQMKKILATVEEYLG